MSSNGVYVYVTACTDSVVENVVGEVQFKTGRESDWYNISCVNTVVGPL